MADYIRTHPYCSVFMSWLARWSIFLSLYCGFNSTYPMLICVGADEGAGVAKFVPKTALAVEDLPASPTAALEATAGSFWPQLASRGPARSLCIVRRPPSIVTGVPVTRAPLGP